MRCEDDTVLLMKKLGLKPPEEVRMRWNEQSPKILGFWFWPRFARSCHLAGCGRRHRPGFGEKIFYIRGFLNMCRPFWFLQLLIVLSASIHAQQVPSKPLITTPINETQLTVLKGNTHPLARGAFVEVRRNRDNSRVSV
jgi:hypothetical protein